MSKLYDGFTDYLEGPDCFAKRVLKRNFCISVLWHCNTFYNIAFFNGFNVFLQGFIFGKTNEAGHYSKLCWSNIVDPDFTVEQHSF